MEKEPEIMPGPVTRQEKRRQRKRACLRALGVVCCMVASAVAGLFQFTADHFLPLLAGCLLLLPAWWLRPGWRWAMALIPVLFLGALLADALLFYHALAVRARIWNIIFGSDHILDFAVSPSRQTAVYVISSNGLDVAYCAYLSDGGLFPRRVGDVESKADGQYEHPRASWDGPLLKVGDKILSFAYDERSGRVHTYTDWKYGRAFPGGPERTPEDFAGYIDSLR